MKCQSKKARAIASKIVDHTTALVSAAGNEAYKNSDQYAKQLRRSYPGLLKSAKTYAGLASSQAVNTLHHAGNTLNHASDHLGHYAHDAVPYLRAGEKKAIRIGFFYLLYKLFVADDKKVYEATTKVKTYVRQKPVQSTFIALGAGLLLGKLFR